MRHGCTWMGCELEPRFVALGEQNIGWWNERFAAKWPGWGQAWLVQGDSRNLTRVLGDARLLVSSPPFGEAQRGGGINLTGYLDDDDVGDRTLTATYGETPGQPGAMKAGDLVVSSPPFEASLAKHSEIAFSEITGNLHRKTSHKSPCEIDDDYGKTEGQTGTMSGDTFWAASRQILAECHAVLAPNSHAIFVCKDFVRNKQRVPFSFQWAELAEACGFRLIHWHRALLVERHGVQMHADGTDDHVETARKSFFRILAERKGSPKINHEDVLCFERL